MSKNGLTEMVSEFEPDILLNTTSSSPVAWHNHYFSIVHKGGIQHVHLLVCHVVRLLWSSTKCGISVAFAILRKTLPNMNILAGRSLLIHVLGYSHWMHQYIGMSHTVHIVNEACSFMGQNVKTTKKHSKLRCFPLL